MLIMIQYYIKNIRNNKGRSLLIIFCIQLSVLLFLSSCSIYRNMLSMSYNQLRQECGMSDIVIKSSTESPTPYFNPEAAGQNNKVKSVVEAIITNGKLYYGDDNTIKITIQGINPEQYETVYGLSLTNTETSSEFAENSIIVSKKTMEKYNLDPNKPIVIDIASQKYEMKLYEAVDTKGYFHETGRAHFAVVSKGFLEEVENVPEGMSNRAYIKLDRAEEIENTIDELARIYSACVIKEPFTQEEAKQETEAISIVLVAITLIAVVISIFIIYTAFKVIMLERLPLIASFRSLGSELWKMMALSIFESLLFAIIGALIGIVLGILFITIILYYTSGGTVTLWEMFQNTLNSREIIFALIFSILLTGISSLLPIIRASKKPIISIIGHELSVNKTNSNKTGTISGAICVVMAIILTYLPAWNVSLPGVVLAIILYLTGVILLVPFIAKKLGFALGKIFQSFSGNITQLATTIFTNTKLVFSSITLISIGMACVVTITVLSTKVISEIVNSFIDRNYELMIEDETFNASMANVLSEIDGVDDCYGVYEKHMVPVENLGTEIWGIQGVDVDKYTDYWEFNTKEDLDQLFSKLESGRTVILTNTLKDKFNLKKGDSLSLKFKNGVKDYEIIGFFDSLLYLGNYALISNNFMQKDDAMESYFRVYIKSSKDPIMVKERIEDVFFAENPTVIIMQELKDDFLKIYNQFFLILKVFSIIAAFIGIFGVMNNTILTFINRKKSFSILRSVGMEVSQIKKILLMESLLASLISTVIGIVSSLILTKQIQNMLAAIHQPITITYSWTELIMACLVGMAVVIISYCIPMRMLSELHIVDGIKQY